jgi:putative acetyltransferase
LNKKILKYIEAQRRQIIDVWEKSVRVTHQFVSLNDIEYFKEIVKTINFSSFEVYCLLSGKKVIGFVGVAGKNIEMLFVDPDFIGHGHGKELALFAIEQLNAETVIVNEQNHLAVAFYKKFGFVTYERTEKDDEGKDYPVLKMKLPTKGNQ